MNNGKEPKLEIVNDKIFWLDDDLGLHQFMRKALPEFWAELEPYHARLKSGERLSLFELFAMFELFRQQMAFIWAAHSPRQQPAFENLIREDWIAVRKAQQHIYDKAVKELERRKAASDPTQPNPTVPPLKPTFDTPTNWQPVNIMGPNGHWPSWWNWPKDPPDPPTPQSN